METRQVVSRRSHQQMRGITLTELLVVIALIGTVLSLSLSSLYVWRNNIVYRQAAQSIIHVLREARSKAITTQYEHRVEINPAGKMYRITQGNRAYRSTKWNVIVQDWISLPGEVLLETNELSIQMNTNGTANGGTIKILDLSAKPKYAVVVNRTGRIRTT